MRKLIGKVLTRRDTSANWTKNNPILGKGECGYATDLRRTKHGDGTTRWNSLPWDDAATTNGHTVNSDVPAGAKFTDTTYSTATTSANGLMSAADKSKLDGIGAGSVSQPTFAGTKATISAAYTPAGTVTVTPDVQLNTTPIAPMDSAGTLPSFTATVTNKKLTLGWNAGTLATKGAAVTVATSIKSQTASATFTGTSGTAVADYTPTGTVSKPTFNCNSQIIE